MSWTDTELFEALGRYEQVCIAATMKPNAVKSYCDYAERFLRWRTGEYWPRDSVPPASHPTRAVASTADLAKDAKAYARVVEAAGREQPTIDTYFRHARFVVRWLDGTFVPGGRDGRQPLAQTRRGGITRAVGHGQSHWRGI